jgi:hypothetical protein
MHRKNAVLAEREGVPEATFSGTRSFVARRYHRHEQWTDANPPEPGSQLTRQNGAPMIGRL